MGRGGLIVAAAMFVASAPAVAEAPSERCAVMVENEAAGTVETEFVAGFVVTGVVPFRLPSGFENATAVMCGREALLIGDDDFRVITEAGLPLFITSGGRLIAFERSNGQFRARTIRGELTEAERTAVQVALNRAQSLAQGETP